MDLVQRQNHTSPCLKFHAYVSQLFWYWLYTFPCTWAQGESPFSGLLSFFCFIVPVSIILICISFVNHQIFISGHYWIPILCCWHSLVRCDTASPWHFSQSSATWTRRCILADGFFLFCHCLLRYLLVIILLSLIKLTSNYFHLSHSFMNNWLQGRRV